MQTDDSSGEIKITQSDMIRDYVFPIVRLKEIAPKVFSVESVCGTGFVIGARGFALTAGHVVGRVEPKELAALFARDSGGWVGIPIMTAELHPSEDVACLRLKGVQWRSFFKLRNRWEGASAKYHLWGYPEDAMYDVVIGDRAAPRPDLIYAAGYIRRRASFAIPGIKGTEFFELSDVAGQGCSGSPVYIHEPPVWDVIGIYVGEKLNHSGITVAYAVREEAFCNWAPAIMGTTILNESLNTSL